MVGVGVKVRGRGGVEEDGVVGKHQRQLWERNCEICMKSRSNLDIA